MDWVCMMASHESGDIVMKCLRCGCEAAVKNGKMKGLQRYRCRDCGYNYTTDQPRGLGIQMKLKALAYHREGMGPRRIGRLLGCSDVAVLQWLKQMGTVVKAQLAAQIPDQLEDVPIVEIDEMWHYTQKNAVSYGSGWLCVVPLDASWPAPLVLVAPKR